MAENLMNKAHKASNKAYRDGWDRIFSHPTYEDYLDLIDVIGVDTPESGRDDSKDKDDDKPI